MGKCELYCEIPPAPAGRLRCSLRRRPGKTYLSPSRTPPELLCSLLLRWAHSPPKTPWSKPSCTVGRVVPRNSLHWPLLLPQDIAFLALLVLVSLILGLDGLRACPSGVSAARWGWLCVLLFWLQPSSCLYRCRCQIFEALDL